MGPDEPKDTVAYMNGEKVPIFDAFDMSKEFVFENWIKSMESLTASFELMIKNMKPLIYWLKKICNEDHKARHYFRMMEKINRRAK